MINPADITPSEFYVRCALAQGGIIEYAVCKFCQQSNCQLAGASKKGTESIKNDAINAKIDLLPKERKDLIRLQTIAFLDKMNDRK